MDVGSKGALKGKPKIFIADAAIRNAVLMIDDVLSDEKSKVTDAFLITKRLDDFGTTKHETMIPILRVPAAPFLKF